MSIPSFYDNNNGGGDVANFHTPSKRRSAVGELSRKGVIRNVMGTADRMILIKIREMALNFDQVIQSIPVKQQLRPTTIT